MYILKKKKDILYLNTDSILRYFRDFKNMHAFLCLLVVVV